MKSAKRILALGLALAMTVTAVPVTNAKAAVKDPKLNTTKKTIYVGQSYTLKLTTPSTWENVKVKKVKTGKKSVATVKKLSEKKFKVTAVKKGTTYAYVKVTGTKDGGKVAKTLKAKFTVRDSEVQFSETEKTVMVGDKTTVTAVSTPESSVTYKSSDAAVAAVDEKTGEVTALKTGTVTITATNKYKKTAMITVKVREVNRVEIHTVSAQQNVETPISFSLFDADGNDVTSCVKVDETCTVTVSGDYAAANTDQPSQATITMSEVGREAEVTVTYNSKADGASDVTTTQKVKCVDAGSSSGGGSASSSGGESTTPAVQGNKVIKSVADINDITVEYGTDAVTAAAKLPGTVMLNCTDGATIRGNVTSWEVDASYDAKPDKQTAYTATGKVIIPSGCKSYYGTTLKATARIIVRGGDTVIKSITVPTGIEVAYGTSEVAAKKRLPSEVELKCVSGMTFATVTWSRKSGTYEAKPASAPATITYAGTVKIPDGYRLDNTASVKTTIETTITILENGKTPKLKDISDSCFVPDTIIPYTKNMDEIKSHLPDKVYLYCVDGSVITVALDPKQWNNVKSVTFGDDTTYESKWDATYDIHNITLPDGYQFSRSQPAVGASIYVKKRDNTKLKAAVIVARNLYYNDRITSHEKFAGGENDKIYVAPEGTTPAQVTAGIKFIVNSGENKKALDAVYYLVDMGEGEIRVFSSDIDSYKPNESQAFVDRKAEEVNAATAALRKILDNNYQIGTCFKTKNIVNNVKALLESESFKKGGNYAYDPANYPMILGKEYMLPQYVTVVVDAKGTKAEVELEWNVGNSDITFDYKETDANGKKLRNAVVTPKSTRDNQPKHLSCVVSVVEYQNGNDWVDLGYEQVEAYNSCLVGAPLYQDTKAGVKIPELFSDTESTFTVQAAFPYYQYYKYVERIELDRITVKNADNSITMDGKPLLSDITVTGVNTAKDDPDFFLEFTMTATTSPLSAVVKSSENALISGINGKVELSIPADAITLTEYAKNQGWYLPEDGLKLEAYVGILPPAVTLKDITLQSPPKEVDITFSTRYWSGSSDVQMALLQQRFIHFVDDDNRISSKSDAVSVNSDGTYWAAIDATRLDTQSSANVYNIWVKVGDGDWLNTGRTYTLS